MSPPDRSILTAADVAERLQVKVRTVHDLARRGALPSFRVGKHRRFVAADIDAWIDGQRQPVGRA